MKCTQKGLCIAACFAVLFSVSAGGTKDISAYQTDIPQGGAVDVTQYALPLPEPLFGKSVAITEKNQHEIIMLTVDKAVAYALENSRTMQSSLIDLDIKERQKNYAWNVFIPSVSVMGTVSRANEKTALSIPGIPLPPTQYTEADYWSILGSVSASLNLNAALVHGFISTQKNYELGLITWEQTRKQTERDITRMFYSILLMQENLNLQQEMLKTAEQRVAQSQANFRNGLAPELTVLQSQVAYENRKPAIQELKYTVNQQLQTFAFLLGFPFGTEISLDGKIIPDFVTLDTNTLITNYTGNRLDIISLQKNIELMELQASASKLQMYSPTLSLSYGWSPVLTTPINESWFGETQAGKSKWTDGGKFSATLTFSPSNWLPFSSAAQNIKNTEANIAKMRINLATAIQSAEMEITNLVNKLNKSKSSIDASTLNISLAQKAYDLTVAAFRSGTKELLDVRDAESQLSQAKLGLLQEQFNYVSGLLDLEYAVNTKL